MNEERPPQPPTPSLADQAPQAPADQAPEPPPAPGPRVDLGSSRGEAPPASEVPPASEAPPASQPPPTAFTGAEPPPLTAFAWRNRLVRPVQGRVLAGVCGGLGRATNTDPVLWRVLFAVLAIFGGIGVLAYLLGWLLLPADGDTASPVEALAGRGQSSTSTALTVVGSVVVLLSLGVFFSEPFRPGPFGLLLLGGAALLLLRDRRGRTRTMAGAHPDQAYPPTTTSGPPSAGVPTGGTVSYASTPAGVPAGPAAASGTTATDPATLTTAAGIGQPFAPHGPFEPVGSAGGYPGRPTPPTPPFGVPPAPPPAPKRPRSRLGRLTFFLVLLAVGALALFDLAGGSIPGPAYLAVALTVIGLGLVVGAWVGRARGLIALGLILTVMLGTATAFDGREWRGGSGSHRWVPASISELQSSYSSGVGDVEIDLSRLDFSGTTQPITLDARLDIGSMRIILPANVDTTVNARVDIGNADVLGETWNGLGLEPRTISDLGADGTGGGQLQINASVDLGNLEVHR